MTKPKNLELLAGLVASGRTIKSAADELGMAHSTAYGMSGSDEFKAEVNRLKTDAINAAVGVLSSAASKAAQTMVDLLSEDHEPKDRLAAARLILSNLQPMAEHNELRQRLDKLEGLAQLRIAK